MRPAAPTTRSTTLEDTRLRLHGRRLRLQRSERHAAEQLARGQDHHAAQQRHAASTTALRSAVGQFVPVSRHHQRQATFTPAANANGAASQLHLPGAGRRRHSQIGGQDLDPSANTVHVQRHRGQRRSGRRRSRRSRPTKTRPTRSPRPTSASAIRTTRRPTTSPAVVITTLPAAGTLTVNGAARDRRPVRPGRPISRRAACSSARPPTPTARRTPASPSRCRTTAAPPTAAGISIRRPTSIVVNVNSVNDAPVGAGQARSTTREAARTTRSPPAISTSAIRMTIRPTPSWR